jgi:hypothetical protein
VSRDEWARRANAAARLEPLADGRRDPCRRDPRMRAWLDTAAPILAASPETPACDGACSALGVAELVWIGEHGCSWCGTGPAVESGAGES